MEHTSAKITYYPLFVIVGYVALGTVFSWIGGPLGWMGAFMGYFFFLFSLFKVLDVPGFARAYKKYDYLAMALPGWAYAYPFVELALACGYLVGWNAPILHAITAVLMGIGLLGVLRVVFRREKIQCACLGTGFNLPMSTITIIEDASMLLMAVWMLAV